MAEERRGEEGRGEEDMSCKVGSRVEVEELSLWSERLA